MRTSTLVYLSREAETVFVRVLSVAIRVSYWQCDCQERGIADELIAPPVVCWQECDILAKPHPQRLQLIDNVSYRRRVCI
jgi:hypothetical protein